MGDYETDFWAARNKEKLEEYRIIQERFFKGDLTAFVELLEFENRKILRLFIEVHREILSSMFSGDGGLMGMKFVLAPAEDFDKKSNQSPTQAYNTIALSRFYGERLIEAGKLKRGHSERAYDTVIMDEKNKGNIISKRSLERHWKSYKLYNSSEDARKQDYDREFGSEGLFEKDTAFYENWLGGLDLVVRPLEKDPYSF